MTLSGVLEPQPKNKTGLVQNHSKNVKKRNCGTNTIPDCDCHFISKYPSKSYIIRVDPYTLSHTLALFLVSIYQGQVKVLMLELSNYSPQEYIGHEQNCRLYKLMISIDSSILVDGNLI